VYRYMTDELLDGQINGRELSVTASNVIGGGNSGSNTSDGYDYTTDTYTDYVTVQDDTSTIQVDIPSAWIDYDGSTWTSTWGDLTFDAPSISASSSLDQYFSTYNESGMFFAASKRLGEIGGYVQLLEGMKGWYENDCTSSTRYDYGSGDFPDPLYEGKFDLWKGCGGTNTEVLILAARPKVNPTSFLIILEVKITKNGDWDALQQILDSFQVIGSF
jgi:hypothetical protein